MLGACEISEASSTLTPPRPTSLLLTNSSSWLTEMPGVKANTQKKGGADEKTGGGGAAGIKARNGGGAQISCAICKT